VLVVGAYLGRAHYADPVIAVENEHGIQVPDGALVLGTAVQGPAGDWVSWEDAWRQCEPEEPLSCMAKRGYDRQGTLYQPADRYWRFQWTETALLLALTVALAGVTAYRVVRRPL
jgi:hypothetical protein